jgi:hypothetical protein
MPVGKIIYIVFTGKVRNSVARQPQINFEEIKDQWFTNSLACFFEIFLAKRSFLKTLFFCMK